jgi:PE family
MSFVTTQPEMLSTGAGNLAGIGSAFLAWNAAAAGPTTGVAAQFARHAQIYQAVSAQAAVIHDQFVAILGSSAASYAATEAANALAAR